MKKHNVFLILCVVGFLFLMGAVTYTIDSVKAPTTSGVTILNNSGATVATFGGAGGTGTAFVGSVTASNYIGNLPGHDHTGDAGDGGTFNQPASRVTTGTFGAGNYVFPGNLTFSGANPTISLTTNGDSLRYTDSTAVLDLYNGGSSVFSVDADNGNGYFAGDVGIRTAAPGTALDVNGIITQSYPDATLKLRNGDEVIGSDNLILTCGGYMNLAAATDIMITQNSVQPFLSVGSGAVANTLYLKQGSVGIGTTGPDAKVDSLATTEQLRLTYTDGSVYTSFTTDSGGDLTIAPTGLDVNVTGNVNASGKINVGAGSALAVAANAITVTKSRHSVNTTATLNTINGGVTGDMLYLCGTAASTVTIADGGGNVQCNANIILDGANDWVLLMFDGSNWQLISKAIDN